MQRDKAVIVNVTIICDTEVVKNNEDQATYTASKASNQAAIVVQMSENYRETTG